MLFCCSLDLKAYLKEEAISKKAKGMTDFTKYVKASDHQFQIMSLIESKVRLNDICLN
jgi:hypothetical protein